MSSKRISKSSMNKNRRRSSILIPQSVSKPIIADCETADIADVTATVAPTVTTRRVESRKSEAYSPKKVVLERTGYLVGRKLSKTIQGSVYEAIDKKGNIAVVKRVGKNLHDKGIAIVDKKLYKVNEDIVQEAKILKLFNNKPNKPKELLKLIDFFCDGRNFFLTMENGGESFFNYVKNMHILIKNGVITLKEWKKNVKVLSKQMIKFIDWLHYDSKYAHLDISLENMLIKGYEIKNGKFTKHGQIKFIDFGLAEKCETEIHDCKKYCGKRGYYSPKIANQVPYNPFKADIWSFGVVFYSLIFGVRPYSKPNVSDLFYSNIINGRVAQTIRDIGIDKYASKQQIDVLQKIFKSEKKRPTAKKLLRHKYFN